MARPSIEKHKLEEVKKLIGTDFPVHRIVEITGVCKSKVYQVRRELLGCASKESECQEKH